MKEKLTVVKVGGAVVEDEAQLKQLLKDFAAIAENPFDSDSLIADIQRSYDLDIENMEEEDEYV